MAIFDIGSGVEGATAGGAFGGPYGALGGLLLGGFTGGSARAAAQNRRTKINRQLAFINSPEFLRQAIARYQPIFRNLLLSSGAGPAITDSIRRYLGQTGLRDVTGFGLTGEAAAAGIPELDAFNQAYSAAREFQTAERARISGQPQLASSTPGALAMLAQIGGLYAAQGGQPFSFGRTATSSPFNNIPGTTNFYGPETGTRTSFVPGGFGVTTPQYQQFLRDIGAV